MQNVFTYISLGFLYLVSLLPLRVLFLFSDLFYVIIRLVGYRRKVIDENLKYSFPEKTDKEITSIRNKFYRHFCDLLVETTKIQNMSEKEMRRRVHFSNVDYLEKANKEGKDVIGVMSHYCNWEWVTSLNLYIEAVGCDVYRPLKNKPFDAYMLKLRAKWGNLNFTMKATMREVIKLRRQDKRFVLGLIADQSPGKPEIQYWTSFLNQNTAVLTGPEKIAKVTKSRVVYFDMRKIKRGYYQVDIVPLVQDSENSKPHEITDAYVSYLESVIKEKPEYWLWSHRRWKYSKNRLLTPQEEIV